MPLLPSCLHQIPCRAFSYRGWCRLHQRPLRCGMRAPSSLPLRRSTHTADPHEVCPSRRGLAVRELCTPRSTVATALSAAPCAAIPACELLARFAAPSVLPHARLTAARTSDTPGPSRCQCEERLRRRGLTVRRLCRIACGHASPSPWPR